MARFIDASIYRNTFPAIRIAILFFTIAILFEFVVNIRKTISTRRDRTGVAGRRVKRYSWHIALVVYIRQALYFYF